MGLTNTDFCIFFLKIGSHGTIQTFKNYFATVISVFSNKRYPNRPFAEKQCLFKMFSEFILLSVLFKTFCQIQMIRDPQRQLEMVGVPEEHLSGHAFHMYHLTSPDQT